MDARSVLGAVWRQRVLVVLLLLATGAATVAGLYYAPRTYTAESTLSASTNPDAETAESDLDSLRATLGELADSAEVIEAVQATIPVQRSQLQLQREISGRWVEGTILVEFDVQDRNPEVAAAIANAVAEQVSLQDPSNGAFYFSVSDPAEPPRSFSSPNVPLVVAAAALLGLLLAASVAVVRDRRHRRVAKPAGLIEAMNAPVLAVVEPPRDETSLPSLYPGTEAAAVFRDLRIALEAQATDVPVRKLVVAGVRGGDVNVWLGANLAIALAQVDRTVLLIDGRMGDRAGRAIEAPPDTPGLFDVLEGAPLLSAVSQGPVERLSVLPPGTVGGDGADRLVESRFGAVAKEATEAFDVVVVLAPALTENKHAVVMAIDGSLLLGVQAGRVTEAQLREHAVHLRSVGARLIGSVLFDRRRGRSR